MRALGGEQRANQSRTGATYHIKILPLKTCFSLRSPGCRGGASSSDSSMSADFSRGLSCESLHERGLSSEAPDRFPLAYMRPVAFDLTGCMSSAILIVAMPRKSSRLFRGRHSPKCSKKVEGMGNEDESGVLPLYFKTRAGELRDPVPVILRLQKIKRYCGVR